MKKTNKKNTSESKVKKSFSMARPQSKRCCSGEDKCQCSKEPKRVTKVQSVVKTEVKASNKKIDLSKLGSDELNNLFTEAFNKQVGINTGINEFECNCIRQKDGVEVEVSIVGMAGTPTVDDFKSNKIKEACCIVVSNERDEVLQFYLIPKNSMILNSNDYMIVYRT